MTTLALEEWRRQAVCPEHQAEQCRTGVALFDFSFMSVLRVTGPDAASLISGYVRRDISGMSAGDIRYCLHADPQHRVRSDLTVWKIDDQTFEGDIADAALVDTLFADARAVLETKEGNRRVAQIV